jgi:hypothetical protein
MPSTRVVPSQLSDSALYSRPARNGSANRYPSSARCSASARAPTSAGWWWTIHELREPVPAESFSTAGRPAALYTWEALYACAAMATEVPLLSPERCSVALTQALSQTLRGGLGIGPGQGELRCEAGRFDAEGVRGVDQPGQVRQSEQHGTDGVRIEGVDVQDLHGTGRQHGRLALVHAAIGGQQTELVSGTLRRPAHVSQPHCEGLEDCDGHGGLLRSERCGGTAGPGFRVTCGVSPVPAFVTRLPRAGSVPAAPHRCLRPRSRQ